MVNVLNVNSLFGNLEHRPYMGVSRYSKSIIRYNAVCLLYVISRLYNLDFTRDMTAGTLRRRGGPEMKEKGISS